MEQLENETQTSKDVNGGTALGNGIFSAEPRHQDQELSRGTAERGHRKKVSGTQLLRIQNAH
jgi:hypothetical protein